MKELSPPARIKAAVWLGVALFATSVALVAMALVWNARKVALDEGVEQATRFVAGAEAALNRSLLAVDLLLASIKK